MLKSKAIDILKTLSKEEFTRFEYFTESPYYNSNNSLARLTKALREFYPDFDSDNMTEEYIYQKVSGKSKFSYSTMKNLMSDLLFLCENFLTTERINRNNSLNSESTIFLLEELRERHLDNLFNMRIKKFEDELKKHTMANHEYFNLYYKLEILKYQFHLEKHSHSKIIWQGFLNRSLFELCMIFSKLYTNTDMLLQSADTLGGKESDSILIKFIEGIELDKFLTCIKPANSEEEFYIYFYAKLILMNLNERKEISEDIFYEIKKLLKSNMNLFSTYDLYDILKSLRSYSITRMHLHRKNFINELYETDKMIAEEINFSSFRLRWYIGEIFTEIVILASYNKDFEYAEKFIDNFGSMLDKDIRDFEVNLARAFLNTEYGKYEKTIELLSSSKPVNPTSKIQVKTLYLRAYFELGYFEEGLFMLDTFKQFVNNENNFSRSKRKYYKTQYSLLYRIYKIRLEPHKFTEADISNLKNDIDELHFLAGLDWYHKKTDEIRKFLK